MRSLKVSSWTRERESWETGMNLDLQHSCESKEGELPTPILRVQGVERAQGAERA